MLAQLWVGDVGRVISSGETKATETARILADHVGLPVEVRFDLGEIDRRSTGFVTAERHERLADRLFAEPTVSADGWERADNAQRRVVAAVADIVSESSDSDSVGADSDSVRAGGETAVIGHGGVGTLLLCHLAGLAIDRSHDQPGQGHFWTYDLDVRRLVHPWRAIDLLESDEPDPAG